MPWCEECAHYFTPSAMNPDGTCPRCGTQLEAPTPPRRGRVRSGGGASGPDGEGSGDHGPDGDEPKAPWHFKLLVVLLVIYLTWRLIQLFV